MLSLLSFLYGQVISVRNRLYDRGVLKSHDLGARTISIGNITTGGTGKTPMVAYVAERLAARGETVCILTRGYGRRSPRRRVVVSNLSGILAQPIDAGDEPYELAQMLSRKAIIIADADRVAAGRWAHDEFGVTAFVLDDSFQHRRVRRHLDIVCIDATNPFGGGALLPAGRMREPNRGLQRADAVLITRANLVSADAVSSLKLEISELNGKAAIFSVGNRIVRMRVLADVLADQAPVAPPEISGNPLAFCGLGNPGAFYRLLRSTGVEPAATRSFGDHHRYEQHDIALLETLAAESDAEYLITTAKDAVKLSQLRFSLPCYLAEIDVLIEDSETFDALL